MEHRETDVLAGSRSFADYLEDVRSELRRVGLPEEEVTETELVPVWRTYYDDGVSPREAVLAEQSWE